ncbi:MAG: GNAT family N-acetyltransferase [Chitinophagaceae bacterium]|nr:GNAT family N-acetyltransferase [Chitinophagaceae bacterium]
MSHSIEIVDFKDEYATAFHDLNKKWLIKYFEIEPIDEKMLTNPVKYYIEPGGHIYFAKMDNDIVGTFALLRVEDGVYELSKMAVAEEHQGKKIGNKMLEFCLKKASDSNWKEVILYSNRILEPALHLYRKYGFEEVPMERSDYKRSNIKMSKRFS